MTVVDRAGPEDAGARHGHRRPRWRHSLGHSLKWRLVALFLLLALGVSAVFFAGSRELFSTGWREVARPVVNDYLDRLAAEIGSPPDVARAQALTQRLPLSIRIEGPQVQWSSHPQRAEYPPTDAGLRRMLVRDSADGHRIRFGLGDWHWPDQPRWHSWGFLAGLVLLTALAYAYVRHLFRPLDDIRAGALRFGSGDFSQAIPLRRRDELGDLADQVNTMASRLRHMLEGQRGLLLAISHELRSPLTRARLNAELLGDSGERAALLRDLGQMRDLISDLLESERLAVGSAALHRAPVSINALVSELVAQQFAGRNITLALDPALPTLPLDAVRMQLLLRNLLDNALRHGGGAPVVLSTRLQLAGEGGGLGEASADPSAPAANAGPQDSLSLTVRDFGPGVDATQLPLLAQAFYRPDAARTRSAGGVGLGLYLCRLVAESHGGTLSIQRAEPGLSVCVALPLNWPPG